MSICWPYITIATLATHAAAYWYWSRRVVPAEVAKNDSDITANGAADDLRKGYHERRSWVRFWWWLGLTLAGSALAGLLGWPAFALSFAALGWLLAAYFARYFTPLLNLARVASGRTDLNEWYASPDSASWPDAAAYKRLRAAHPNYTPTQLAYSASIELHGTLTRTWLYGRLGYGLLLVAAVVAGFLK